MPRFPGNLESQYSRAFSRYVDDINFEYIKVMRQLLSENKDETFVSNGRIIIYNSFDSRKFTGRFENIRELLDRKLLRRKIFLEMDNVFRSIENKVVGDIADLFKQKRFPIPMLGLRAASESLKQAISTNIALIENIENIQITRLENAVKSSITGATNFQSLVNEVDSQARQGKAYAEFVARDQVAKTHSKITKEKSIGAGFTGYIWRATNDERTRPDHAAQDGKFFRWDKPPILINGALDPGEDFQCRCIAEPAFEARPSSKASRSPFFQALGLQEKAA